MSNFSLFLFIRQAIIEENRPILLRFLHILSYPFSWIAYLRRLFYQKCLFSSYRSPKKVISIGSPVTGGTGKTPFLLFLLEKLDPKNVAILSRGYLAKGEKKNISIQNTPYFDPKWAGDEPYLIQKTFPEALVIVGKKRVKSAKLAEQKGKSLLILDDGMQHFGLKRDLEVITLLDKDLQSTQYFLPRGFLREGMKELSRADLIVVTGKNFSKSLLRKWTKAPLVIVEKRLEKVQFLQKEKISSKDCAAFTAIARPEEWIASLRKEKFALKKTLFFRDHQEFSLSSLEKFWQEAKNLGAKSLICTEKDAVKLPSKLSFPLGIIPMRLEVIEGEKKFQKFIQKIQNY